MKIFFGSDHAGFELKGKLIPFVQSLGYEVVDKGPSTLDLDDDYPDFVVPVAREVARDPESARGIIIGGSGQGEAITANRFAGVMAVVFNGQYKPIDGREIPNEIVISREHNNSNILSLGARFLNEAEAKVALELWLKTQFTGEARHVRRLAKIDKISL